MKQRGGGSHKYTVDEPGPSTVHAALSLPAAFSACGGATDLLQSVGALHQHTTAAVCCPKTGVEGHLCGCSTAKPRCSVWAAQV